MAEQRLSNELSSAHLPPALGAVLSSLNVNLEAELNRYRRTRHTRSIVEEDIFADLDAVIKDAEDLEFAFDAAQPSISVPAVTIPDADIPPPPPRNRKLLSGRLSVSGSDAASNLSESQIEAGFGAQPNHTGSALAAQSLAAQSLATQAASADHLAVSTERTAISADDNHFNRLVKESVESSSAVIKAPLSSGYLVSSEELIESLSDVADMPEPVSLNPEPRRKTVSVMAGATLGLLALVAGLGASYVMSNPEVAQTLANGFQGESATINPAPQPTFDPPGPDLSAQEFVNLKLDNLSSLNMQPSLDPLATSARPPVPDLPPIEGSSSQLAPSAASDASSATQALAIPAGANYYVTVPFSTEQGLIEVRRAVEEAFVRQFSDGNRIQLAVFDNLETAQSFISQLQKQGVQAQIYGPTAE